MRVTTVDDHCRLFFSTFFRRVRIFEFSEKGYWARCFGKRFGSSEGVRGGFLGIRGGSRRPLGASWGCPGGVRGASWERLGRSWGDLGATFKAVRFRIVFLIDFERQKGAQREAFGEPKWSQNRSQNNSKSKSIFKSEKNTLQDRLGAVLGRSWAILTGLGPSWGDLEPAGEAKFVDFPQVFQYF